MYNNILKRKQKIIITAIDLLEEGGINGLTTKEIARRQDITEPAIYKQFSGKKEIIIAILDQYAAFDVQIKNTILDNGMEGKAGIEYFARAYAEYYQNYPQIATVLFSFDIYRYDPDINEIMKGIVKDRYNLIFNLISKSVAKEEITLNRDPSALTDTIFGIIWGCTYAWKMDGCGFDLKERILKSIGLILK